MNYQIDAVGGKRLEMGYEVSQIEYEILEGLNLHDHYYLSFEGILFVEFSFGNVRNFIKSWKVANQGYDLTFFNRQVIFVVNDNESHLSIHKVDLSSKIFEPLRINLKEI